MHYLRKPFYEAVIITYQTHEISDIFHVPRCWSFNNQYNLFEVHCDTFFEDDVFEILHIPLENVVHDKLVVQLLLLQNLQHKS